MSLETKFVQNGTICLITQCKEVSVKKIKNGNMGGGVVSESDYAGFGVDRWFFFTVLLKPFVLCTQF